MEKLPANVIAIPEYPGYYVTAMGEVWSTRQGKPKKMRGKDHLGYRMVSLCVKGRQTYMLVHRAVLLAFEGPPTEGQTHTRHLNGVRDDNRLRNLAWATPAENARDRERLLESSIGEDRYNSKLTEAAVGELRRLRTESPAEWPWARLADRFGVVKGIACAAGTGRTWRHLNEKYPPAPIMRPQRGPSHKWMPRGVGYRQQSCEHCHEPRPKRTVGMRPCRR